MATINRGDPLSWKARGTAVRDSRHEHAGPEVASAPSRPRDTKRWCKGKVGREHALVVRDARELGKYALQTRQRLVQFCSKCGKELDSWSAPMVCGILQKDGTIKACEIFVRPQPEWARKHLEGAAA